MRTHKKMTSVHCTTSLLQLLVLLATTTLLLLVGTTHAQLCPEDTVPECICPESFTPPTASPTSSPTGAPTNAPSARPTRSPLPPGMPTTSPTQSPTGSPTPEPACGTCPFDAGVSCQENRTLAQPGLCNAQLQCVFMDGTLNVVCQSLDCQAENELCDTCDCVCSQPQMRKRQTQQEIVRSCFVDGQPTAAPTASPSASPTGAPSVSPTVQPTTAPSVSPSASPTGAPTTSPTTSPSSSPTNTPTTSPSSSPTTSPTSTPTNTPTTSPTSTPTNTPTTSPSASPSGSPTSTPTTSPSALPSSSPSTSPTASPTELPGRTLCDLRDEIIDESTCQTDLSFVGQPLDEELCGVVLNTDQFIPFGGPVFVYDPRGDCCFAFVDFGDTTLGDRTFDIGDKVVIPPNNQTTLALFASLSQYAETNFAEFQVQSSNNPLGCRPITCADLNNATTAERLESCCVELCADFAPESGNFPSSNRVYTVTDQNGDMCSVFVDSDTNIGGTMIPSGASTVRGILSQFDPNATCVGFQVQPRFDTDITGQGCVPTASPTGSPSASPTTSPSTSPSVSPTNSPSALPSVSPTNVPSNSPTSSPSVSPSNAPTRLPSNAPSISPTASPTLLPNCSEIEPDPETGVCGMGGCPPPDYEPVEQCDCICIDNASGELEGRCLAPPQMMRKRGTLPSYDTQFRVDLERRLALGARASGRRRAARYSVPSDASGRPVGKRPSKTKEQRQQLHTFAEKHGQETADDVYSLQDNNGDRLHKRIAIGGILQQFAAANEANALANPPDNHGAAGTLDDVVSVVNVRIEARTKSTGAVIFAEQLSTFFQSLPLGTTPPFDPRAAYDRYADRYVVTAITQSDGAQISEIVIAVSNDASAGPDRNDWTFQLINANTLIGGQPHWCDFDQLGFDDDALFISCNMFPFGAGSGGERTWIVDKTGLYAGGSSTFVVTDPTTLSAGAIGTTQAPTIFDGDTTSLAGVNNYLVGYDGLNDGLNLAVMIIPIAGTAAAPIYNPAHFVNWGLFGIDDDFSGLQEAPQPGGVTPFDAGDRRVWDSYWRDGMLYFVSTIIPMSGPDAGQQTVIWWQFDTTVNPLQPTLVQFGTVGGEDFETGASTFYPAIAVNAIGTVKIGFSLSSVNVFAGIYAVARLANEPAGTTGPTEELRAGTATHFISPTRNRWGDYSKVVVDSADDTSFWVFNSIADTGNIWRVYVTQCQAEFSLCPPGQNATCTCPLLPTSAPTLVPSASPTLAPSPAPTPLTACELLPAPECGTGVCPQDPDAETPCDCLCVDNTTTVGSCFDAPLCPSSGDDCDSGSLVEVFDGRTEFCTTGATDSLPNTFPACITFGANMIGSDIWYRYTATCTGTLTVSTCNDANYDTTLLLHDTLGAGCPGTPEVGCNDDGVGCAGFTSIMTASVTQSTEYLLRVGGFGGDSGMGAFTISCAAMLAPPSRPQTADCCSVHGQGAGCFVDECATDVCRVYPQCCTDDWTAECAAAARVMCTESASCPALCPADAANTCCKGAEDSVQVGCQSQDCCMRVCAPELVAGSSIGDDFFATGIPECCLDRWSSTCGLQARRVRCAGSCPKCRGARCFDTCAENAQNSCCEATTEGAHEVSCNDESCCDRVCNFDEYCCEVEWDEQCARTARILCSQQGETCSAVPLLEKPVSHDEGADRQADSRVHLAKRQPQQSNPCPNGGIAQCACPPLPATCDEATPDPVTGDCGSGTCALDETKECDCVCLDDEGMESGLCFNSTGGGSGGNGALTPFEEHTERGESGELPPPLTEQELQSLLETLSHGPRKKRSVLDSVYTYASDMVSNGFSGYKQQQQLYGNALIQNRTVRTKPLMHKEENWEQYAQEWRRQTTRLHKRAVGSIDSFAGPTYADNGARTGSSFIPPDPHNAAGIDQLVSVDNVIIDVYDKTPPYTPLYQASLMSFFSTGSVLDAVTQLSAPPATFTFDPKVLWDHYENRWFVITIEQEDVGDPAPADTSYMFVAVSNSTDASDPTDWYKWRIDSKLTFVGGDVWADYPNIALDEEAIYLSMNMFPFSTSGASFGQRVWILNKSSFYNGGAITFTVHDPSSTTGCSTSATIAPAEVYGTGGIPSTGVCPAPDNVGTYLLLYSGLSNGIDEFLQIITVCNPLTAPTFICHIEPVGDIDDTAAAMPNAPQSGSATEIETNDRRMLDVVWRDNQLYAVAVIRPSAGQDPVNAGQATAHWWHLSTLFPSAAAPSLIQQGSIGGEDIAVGAFTFFPSVAVNQFGSVKIGFSAVAATIFAGAYATGRLASDAIGTVQASVTVQAGIAPYVRTFGGTRNRWGDYSGTVVDPVDDTTFWVYNEYAWLQGQLGGGEDGRWATHWLHCSVNEPEELQLCATNETAVCRCPDRTTAPSVSPSVSPTSSPSVSPSTTPTASPSVSPTLQPTTSPVTPGMPTGSPVPPPTTSPSTSPSVSPTNAPSVSPTSNPTTSPSVSPTGAPSVSPTRSPTGAPTTSPTENPTASPTTFQCSQATPDPTTADCQGACDQGDDVGKPCVCACEDPNTMMLAQLCREQSNMVALDVFLTDEADNTIVLTQLTQTTRYRIEFVWENEGPNALAPLIEFRLVLQSDPSQVFPMRVTDIVREPTGPISSFFTDTSQLSIEFNPFTVRPPAGNYTLQMRIDSPNDIAETNEADNVAESSVEILQDPFEIVQVLREDWTDGTANWTTSDGVDRTDYWQTFTYMPGPSYDVWWCGTQLGDYPWVSTWPTLPGYGNSWVQRLEKTFVLVSNSPSFSFVMRYDTEFNYDFVRVFASNDAFAADSTSYHDDACVSCPSAGCSGSSPGTDGFSLYSCTLTPYSTAESVTIRFEFISDSSYSDQDALFSSNFGAVMLDEVTVGGFASDMFTAGSPDGWAYAPLAQPSTEYRLEAAPLCDPGAAALEPPTCTDPTFYNVFGADDLKNVEVCNVWAAYDPMTQVFPDIRNVDGVQDIGIQSVEFDLPGLPSDGWRYWLANGVYGGTYLEDADCVFFQHSMREVATSPPDTFPLNDNFFYLDNIPQFETDLFDLTGADDILSGLTTTRVQLFLFASEPAPGSFGCFPTAGRVGPQFDWVQLVGVYEGIAPTPPPPPQPIVMGVPLNEDFPRACNASFVELPPIPIELPATPAQPLCPDTLNGVCACTDLMPITPAPTASPTPPTPPPTASPTANPSASPTASPTPPTPPPTASPSVLPSASPTASPSASPTVSPTTSATVSPTTSPSVSPSGSPTASPVQVSPPAPSQCGTCPVAVDTATAGRDCPTNPGMCILSLGQPRCQTATATCMGAFSSPVCTQNNQGAACSCPCTCFGSLFFDPTERDCIVPTDTPTTSPTASPVTTIQQACQSATNDCTVPSTTPGCSDQTCCQNICEVQPSCCTDAWTQADCANIVPLFCP